MIGLRSIKAPSECAYPQLFRMLPFSLNVRFRPYSRRFSSAISFHIRALERLRNFGDKFATEAVEYLTFGTAAHGAHRPFVGVP